MDIYSPHIDMQIYCSTFCCHQFSTFFFLELVYRTFAFRAISAYALSRGAIRIGKPKNGSPNIDDITSNVSRGTGCEKLNAGNRVFFLRRCEVHRLGTERRV